MKNILSAILLITFTAGACEIAQAKQNPLSLFATSLIEPLTQIRGMDLKDGSMEVIRGMMNNPERLGVLLASAMSNTYPELALCYLQSYSATQYERIVAQGSQVFADIAGSLKKIMRMPSISASKKVWLSTLLISASLFPIAVMAKENKFLSGSYDLQDRSFHNLAILRPCTNEKLETILSNFDRCLEKSESAWLCKADLSSYVTQGVIESLAYDVKVSFPPEGSAVCFDLNVDQSRAEICFSDATDITTGQAKLWISDRQLYDLKNAWGPLVYPTDLSRELGISRKIRYSVRDNSQSLCSGQTPTQNLVLETVHEQNCVQVSDMNADFVKQLCYAVDDPTIVATQKVDRFRSLIPEQKESVAFFSKAPQTVITLMDDGTTVYAPYKKDIPSKGFFQSIWSWFFFRKDN